MGPPHEGSIRRPTAPWANALPLSYVPLPQAEGSADVDIAKTAVNIAFHYTDWWGQWLDDSATPFLYGTWTTTLFYSYNPFTGCDSMSRVQEFSDLAYTTCKEHKDSTGARNERDAPDKISAKLAKGDPVLQSCANAFTLRGTNHSDIELLGSQAMSVTFGGESTCSLTASRYGIFTKKVVSAKSFVTPERLTPTDSATKFNSLKLYNQTMSWVGMESYIYPLDWGWRLEDNQPIISDTNAALDTILKMAHCHCLTGCSGPRCCCRKHGPPFNSAWGSWQLVCCDNQLDNLMNMRTVMRIKWRRWNSDRLGFQACIHPFGYGHHPKIGET